MRQNNFQAFFCHLAGSGFLATYYEIKYTHNYRLPFQVSYERTRLSAIAGPNPISRHKRSTSVGASSISSRGTSLPMMRWAALRHERPARERLSQAIGSPLLHD